MKRKVISVAEAAQRLGVNRSIITRALNTGNRGLAGYQETIEGQPRPVWRVYADSLTGYTPGKGGKPTHKPKP